MKIRVDFGYANGDGDNLAEHLGLVDRHMDVEASTAREVFEFLHSHIPKAQTYFDLTFTARGHMRGTWLWIVGVNRDRPNARGIRSDADLDIPLLDEDRIYITSAC